MMTDLREGASEYTHTFHSKRTWVRQLLSGFTRILHPSNVDKEKLMEYAIKAAQFSTEYKSRKLPHTDWSMIPRGPPPGVPDVCIFDFTNLYAARVAARVTVRYGTLDNTRSRKLY